MCIRDSPEIAYASALPVMDLDFAQSRDFLPSNGLRLAVDSRAEEIKRALDSFFKAKSSGKYNCSESTKNLAESRSVDLISSDLISLLKN